MVQLIVITALFVLASGLVALVEASILSLSSAEAEAMAARRQWGFRKVRRVRGQMTRAVVAIVIITNLVNILGPILVGHGAVALYGDGAIVWVTGGLLLLTIVFSEIIPKSVGVHRAPRISRFAAGPVLGIIYLLYPLVLLFDGLMRVFQAGKREVGTEVQVRALTTLGRRAGHIEPDEDLLVSRVFRLKGLRAVDVMTPWSEVVALRDGMSLSEASERVLESAFSRYPVHGQAVDEVRGFVLGRDILREALRGQEGRSLEGVLREALVVPAERPCDDLLLGFRLRRLHLAVVEEAGKAIGIVTLEDVLEELVGEIHDEKDVAF